MGASEPGTCQHWPGPGTAGESWGIWEEGQAAAWCLQACLRIAPHPGPTCGGPGLTAWDKAPFNVPPGPDGRTPPPGEHAGATGVVPGCVQPALRGRGALPHHPEG